MIARSLPLFSPIGCYKPRARSKAWHEIHAQLRRELEPQPDKRERKRQASIEYRQGGGT